MTGPNPDIGKAEIEVVADTSHFPESARRGVSEGLHGSDEEIKRTGEQWGDTLGENTGKRFKSRVPDIVRDVESEFKRQKVTEHVDLDVDYDRNRVRNKVKRLADELENDFTSSGVFGKIGQAFTDAIGAGFNVSGRSPLIIALIPLIGVIAALVTALLQSITGIAAALLTIPNLISAIAIQAGVLYLVFHNIGDSLSKALAAENATELQKVLDKLPTPIAQFEQSVVEIRDAFRDISQYASIAFFHELGSTLLAIFDINRYTLFHGIVDTAAALGKWFKDIGNAFASSAFTKFLSDLFFQIDHFLKSNGPVLEKFLIQLFKFLDALMGPLNEIGGLFNVFLTNFGDWLEELSKSKDFQEFLDQMPGMLVDLGSLIGALLKLAVDLFDALNDAGGEDFIRSFTDSILLLDAVINTQNFRDGLELLLFLIKLLADGFFALVVGTISVLGFLDEAYHFIVDVVVPGIGTGFKKIFDAATSVFDPENWRKWIDVPVNFFHTLITRATDAGARLLQGFIDGILSKMGPLGNALKIVGQFVSDHLPHSPAKIGPLSGKGAPFVSGQALVRDFAKGIMTASDQVTVASNNAMSNVNFGTGAVVANFYGSQPTQEQARTLGTAVAGGIGDQLLARNARLAVRTM